MVQYLHTFKSKTQDKILFIPWTNVTFRKHQRIPGEEFEFSKFSKKGVSDFFHKKGGAGEIGGLDRISILEGGCWEWEGDFI